eukprot:366472-Chlamydomonas_euryale.AAC.14
MAIDGRTPGREVARRVRLRRVAAAGATPRPAARTRRSRAAFSVEGSCGVAASRAPLSASGCPAARGDAELAAAEAFAAKGATAQHGGGRVTERAPAGAPAARLRLPRQRQPCRAARDRRRHRRRATHEGSAQERGVEEPGERLGHVCSIWLRRGFFPCEAQAQGGKVPHPVPTVWMPTLAPPVPKAKQSKKDACSSDGLRAGDADRCCKKLPKLP